MTTDGFAPRPPARAAEIVADYEALGLSAAGHPMEEHRAWCRLVGALDSAEVQRCRGGEWVLVAGLVTTRQRPSTAKGTVFLLLEDEHGATNAIVSARVDAAHSEAVRHAQFALVYGKAERDGPMVNVIAKRVERLAVAEAVRHPSHDFR